MSPPTNIDPPAWAQEPCRIPVIAFNGTPTWADLEAAYIKRGEAIENCEQARRLNAEAHLQERQAVADWIEE